MNYPGDCNWEQILSDYNQLMIVQPQPGVVILEDLMPIRWW